MALIDSYSFEIFPIPCEIGSEQWKLHVNIGSSISYIFPYLNGYFKKRLYYPELQSFIFTFENHKISLKDKLIMIARINSKEEGKEIAEKLINFLNDFDKKKDKIVPVFEKVEPPKALDIYKLLPKTNCKKCNEPSCFVFATKLSQGDKEIENCPELTDKQLKEIQKLFA